MAAAFEVDNQVLSLFKACWIGIFNPMYFKLHKLNENWHLKLSKLGLQ